jgi:hypothetical protein
MDLVALDEAEHQVADVELPTPHMVVMVPSQHLLVFGRVEEGDITCFLKLIHGIFERRLCSLLIV